MSSPGDEESERSTQAFAPARSQVLDVRVRARGLPGGHRTAGDAERDEADPRGGPALWVFLCIEAVALALCAWWGRGGWFNGDDWDFLAARKAGNVGDLFRSHFGHWTTLPILAYRLLWHVVGLRSYTPYLLVVVIGHLTVALLLLMVMRRAGVGPWLSTLMATIFVFFGSGAENILVAFQITFVGALAFGLGQLLLADHDGPLDRRDYLGLLAGFAGLLCSGVALAVTASVGLAVLMRRGWRLALFHTLPLASACVIWSLAAPEGQSTSTAATSPSGVFRFVAIGIEAAFARLGQLPGVGLILGLGLIVGLAFVFASGGWQALHGRTAISVALLGGAVVFLVATGAFRSGQVGVLAFHNGAGPARARLSRYVYVVVALALPAIAVAAQAIIRRRPRLTVVVLILLVVGIPGNMLRFSGYAQPLVMPVALRRSILSAARLPVAAQLPRALQPQPFLAPLVTIGWLRDNLSSGRIPSPGRLTPNEIAGATLYLALQSAEYGPATLACRRLVRRTVLDLPKRRALTVKVGVVNVVYLASNGGISLPRKLSRTRVVALAGPLRLLLIPVSKSEQHAVICT